MATNSTRPNDRLRIGAVNYLNSKPLVYQLEQLAPQAEIIYDLPSRLADGLAAGKLDVALIPSVATFQDSSYTIISDACVGCHGPVFSVKLFSHVPIDQIRTVALDEGSRTSAALVQILLHEQHGIQAELMTLPIGSGLSETDADAVLLIGDRAMHSPPGNFHVVWDLGDRWNRWCSLPFVFAMWTARSGVSLDGLDETLSEARNQGIAHLEEIATAEAAGLGLTVPQCLEYFQNNLNFHLGEDERKGLELFYQHASNLGLAPSGVDLEFGHLNTSR